VRISLALAPLLFVACAKKPTIDRSVHLGEPSRELPPIEDVPVHGFRVTVEARARSVTGELLAVDRANLWVLEGDDAGDHPVAIPRRDVRQVGVQALPSGGIVTNPWTIAGTLSTFSHGYFLIFSAPVWAIVGFGTGIDEGVSNDLHVDRPSLDSLSQYARFPQGLPPGFLRGGRR
jgi:hypothetical protein